jgi:hypothetical protein
VKRLVPWLVAVAFFMESLDTTILNTAVPTIAAALRIAPLGMKSVLSCYTRASRRSPSRKITTRSPRKPKARDRRPGGSSAQDAGRFSGGRQ